MTKILITGSSGFLGKHLINSMQNSQKIIGWSNNNQQTKLKNFEHTKIDLTSKNISIKSKISSIIHLAAISDVKYCNSNPSLCSDINILGTKKMLEICRKKDANFIFASTSHVYGQPKKNPICEKEDIKPNSIYAATKIIGENMCESYAKTYGLDISVLRFFSLYGPNSPKHNVIYNIINQYKSNSKIKIGNLKPKRDFLYVDDAINAIKIINKNQKGFQILNVGSGKSFSIEKICEKIEKIMKRKMKIEIDQNKIRKNDILEIRCDNKKIKKMFGWKPQIPLEKGLEKTCNFY
jgi:nucleoside-diphosphate-sugar epimerase